MRIRRSPLIGLFLAAVLGVGACSGGADPKSTFTPTSTYSFPGSSATPSKPGSTPPARSTSPPPVATTGPNVRSGEKPPVLPAAAKHNTPAGAAAFAQYWIRTLDWAYATTNTTLAHAVFSPSCSECARFVGIIDRARQAGHHFVGGRITQTKWAVAAPGDHNGASEAIDVTFAQQAVREVDRSGHTRKSGSATPKIVYRVWLKWSGTRWTVVDMKQVVQR